MKKLCFIFGTVACLTFVSCSNSYREVRLSIGGFGLSDTAWLDVHSRSPLSCSRDTCGILFTLDSQYSLRNGTVVIQGNELKITAQVAGSKGTRFLTQEGLWGKDIYLGLEPADNSGPFSSIQLRSNIPVLISNLRWVTYNWRDVNK